MAKRQNIRKGILIISLLLFPITMFYISPYIIVVGAVAGIATGSFIVYSMLFVLSLFFGRAFCGYVCPMAGLQECLILAQNKKAKGGKRNFIKYFLWVPWVATIVVFFVHAGGIKEVDFAFQTTNGISVIHPIAYIVYYGILMVIIILALTMGKRAMCHYLCPVSVFMVIGTKISQWLKLPRLRLTSNHDSCVGCKRCDKKCPMSLDVNAMAVTGNTLNSECILCGECVDTCPKKSIAYSFSNKPS